MKKYIFLLVFLSVFLTSCQKSNYIELDFYDTSVKFSKQVEDMFQNIQKFGFSGQINTELELDLKGENKDFDFKSKINLTGDIDFITKDNDLSIHTTLLFDDKKEKQITNISGFLNLLSTQNQNFLQISDLYIDLGPANYQNNLFLLISKYLTDKRIFIGKNENYLYENIYSLLQNIMFLNVFENIQRVKYDTNLAYKVGIKKDILTNLNQNENFQIDDFKGLFIILSTNDIKLKIEELNISLNGKKINISGFISQNNLELFIRDLQDVNNLVNYDFYSIIHNKNNYKLVFKKISNHQEDIVLKLNINNKTIKTGISNLINGNIILSSNFIYGIGIEKDVQININSKQRTYTQSGFNIKLPSSYIHLDQILGDNFSLKNILSEGQF